MIKPRVFWQYYPASRRGYWRVNHMPRPFGKYMWLWQAAHVAVAKINGASWHVVDASEYAAQLELRKTT